MHTALSAQAGRPIAQPQKAELWIMLLIAILSGVQKPDFTTGLTISAAKASTIRVHGPSFGGIGCRWFGHFG